jgi:hypothetical protein
MTFTQWLIFGGIALWILGYVFLWIRFEILPRMDSSEDDSRPTTARQAVASSLGTVLGGVAVLAVVWGIWFSGFFGGSEPQVTAAFVPQPERSSFMFGDYSVYLEDGRVVQIDGPFEIVVPAVMGGRTGAICVDGWRSSATGSGACSHHGGVARWTHRVTEPERTEMQSGVVCYGVETGPWSLRESLDDPRPHCWNARVDAYESNAALEAIFAELPYGVRLIELGSTSEQTGGG